MFVYNTRTELSHGTQFIEKDIILFDYSYSGDILFQVDARLTTPGFGFVIREELEEQAADSAILISFSNDNSYRIILKEGINQNTVVHQFIEAATTVYDPEGIIFFFKKHNDMLSVCRAIRQSDGTYQEIRLLEYRMQYDMERYQIGIYSNAGNTVTFASVKTEAPSNWITNVFNAGGGRVKWIRNGFVIDEAEYDIEVEAEDIQLKAGTYWFDYKTTNPDMKVYVYPTQRKHTATKRLRAEIIDTMIDEEKNILEADGKFVLPKDHAINIKFKGKWGTVTEICVKDNKFDSFIETGYGVTTRPGSRLIFDLTKIASIHMRGIIQSIPIQDPGETRKYNLFRNGDQSFGIISPVTIGEEYTYDFHTSDKALRINDEEAIIFTDTSKTLVAFENVTAVLQELILTLRSGETINVLLQKTIKATVGKNIQSPIIVLNSDGEPLDLSSSYRLLADPENIVVLYNALNPIKLPYDPLLSDMELTLYGIPAGVVIQDPKAKTIQDLADTYTKISYEPDKTQLLRRVVKIPYEIRSAYKYIAVAYRAIKKHRYCFTNWDRELFDLSTDSRLYLSAMPLGVTDGIVMYGIPEKEYFNQDMLYYIENPYDETSIDLCAYLYTEIPRTAYHVNASKRIVVDPEILKEYKYLIVDYLKQESYAVNEKDDYYEVDIATADTDIQVLYDSEDGTTTQAWRILTLEQVTRTNVDSAIESDDFIVLEDIQ